MNNSEIRGIFRALPHFAKTCTFWDLLDPGQIAGSLRLWDIISQIEEETIHRTIGREQRINLLFLDILPRKTTAHLKKLEQVLYLHRCYAARELWLQWLAVYGQSREVLSPLERAEKLGVDDVIIEALREEELNSNGSCQDPARILPVRSGRTTQTDVRSWNSSTTEAWADREGEQEACDINPFSNGIFTRTSEILSRNMGRLIIVLLLAAITITIPFGVFFGLSGKTNSSLSTDEFSNETETLILI